MNKENKDSYIKREKYLLEKKYELIESIGKIRRDSSLTQRDLSETIGITQPSLVRIEKGKVIPSIEMLLKILYPEEY